MTSAAPQAPGPLSPTTQHRPLDGPADVAVVEPIGTRRSLVFETLLVLGVSLGASAIWSIISIIEKLTRPQPLGQQTTAMNSSATPDRLWLDFIYQLVGNLLPLVPVVLALYLLARVARPSRAGTDGAGVRWWAASGTGRPETAHSEPARTETAHSETGHSETGHPDIAVLSGVRRLIGFDLTRMGADLLRGASLAALIGLPGLGLYFAARAMGLNTSIAAANLADVWWSAPMLTLAAIQNAVLEEVVMVAYLYTRWRQAGWSWPRVLVVSALVRGCYHLYQGFGGFIGNVVMGLVLGYVYKRTGRVMPLVICHALLDIVAFVGYAVLRARGISI